MVFSRFFRKKDPFDQLCRAYTDKRWADCLRLGREISTEGLSEEKVSEISRILETAGDTLCRFNIEEGTACIRGGDSDKAREHLSLALTQACSEELKSKAQGLLSGIADQEQVQGHPENATAHCGSGCGSSSPRSTATDSPEMPDDATRFELTLATYPPHLAQRYLEKSEKFRDGFFAAHDGRDEEALDLLDEVTPEERDDLFLFERGALYGRLGNYQSALQDLEQALALNPANSLALEALLSLEAGKGHLEKVEKLAQQGVETGTAVSFCLGQLACLRMQEEKFDEALDYGKKALASGQVDRETLLLTAALYERRGDLDEAENLLGAMGGSGCGGGVSPSLAEFWLRHGRNLDKAIDAFNHAARSEPQNPRWAFRVGEAYIARGWKKEGVALVEKAISHPALPPELAEKGRGLLAS